jgi:Ca2+-dependent lipid-binding protein
MAGNSGNWDALAIGIVSIFVGVIGFVFTQSIFNLFFVAIVGAVLWSNSNKVNDLRRKFSEMERKLSQVPTASAVSP